jgi:hypothetical protein
MRDDAARQDEVPGEAPWWASGASPDEGAGWEDPLLAHRTARAGAGSGPGEPGDASGTSGSGPAPGPEWWRDAAAAVTELGRAARSAGEGLGQGAGHRHDPQDATACQVCPVCALLRALEQARPEVVAHLGEAVRHLSAAARALLDAHADTAGRPAGGFEHIDLDDDLDDDGDE